VFRLWNTIIFLTVLLHSLGPLLALHIGLCCFDIEQMLELLKYSVRTNVLLCPNVFYTWINYLYFATNSGEAQYLHK